MVDTAIQTKQGSRGVVLQGKYITLANGGENMSPQEEKYSCQGIRPIKNAQGITDGGHDMPDADKTRFTFRVLSLL